MRVFARTVAIAAVLISFAGMAAAAEIRVLSVGAVQHAVRNLVAEFEKETGHRIVLSVSSPAIAMQKIKAGEVHDAVIVSEPAMDQLDRDGIVNPESRVRLASTGLVDAGKFQTGTAGGQIDRSRRSDLAQSERRKGRKGLAASRHLRCTQGEA